MTGGDSAIVSIQYSYLPSWISYLVDQKEAREAGRALFDAVYDRWSQLSIDDRPKLIEILGKDFDFTALTEVDDAVREEILEELQPETVAEGMRDLDSDDAVYILEDMDEADKAEILDKLGIEPDAGVVPNAEFAAIAPARRPE